MDARPETFQGLFDFYYTRFKPLYSLVSADNKVPFELLTEAFAALDHISRHWRYGEPEQKSVNRSVAHLKRASFDAFKLVLKQTMDDYRRLLRVDTSVIDNGDFDLQLTRLIREIRHGAAHARSSEGNDEESWHRAFLVWEKVLHGCRRFYDSFYHHDRVPWARRRGIIRFLANFSTGFITGLVSGSVVRLWWDWWKTPPLRP